MSTNQITVVTQNGGTELVDLTNLVNANTAALEASRPAPPLHKRELVLVHIDPQKDCAVIKGGQAYIKHPARARLAAAAGVREYAPPTTETYEQDGKIGTRVTVALWRPGVIDHPVYGTADGFIADQPVNGREHFTAKLATRAHKRALSKILGESFLYDPRELAERNGLFVVACVSEDTSDPDVRQIMLERMRGGVKALYPQPTAPALPAAAPEVVEIPDEYDAEFDVIEMGEEASEPTAGAGSSDSSVGSSSPSLPEWARGFARDRTSGAVNWESLPIETVEKRVRQGIKSAGYNHQADPAEIVVACKAGEWHRAAARLLAWEQTGGGLDA